MSTFDITSDLVNSLDFLGHNASTTILGVASGTFGILTNNNETTRAYALNATVTYSPKCKLFNTSIANFNENNNITFDHQIENYLNTNFVCSSEGVDAHVVWGAL